jgi:hypothetical protein
MKDRVIWPATAVLIAVILAAGGVITARSLRSDPVIIRRVPGPAVTVTARPAEVIHHVVRWRTRTVTGSGVPCLELGGKTWFAGGAASGAGVITTTCKIIPVEPYSTGMIEAVTADGQAAEYYSPAGGGN